MKNKLMLRLCLMMAVVMSTYSCRQDILPEKETYNNTSAFQLTTKRISLNEAKHKAKLIPELEKVKAKFKAFSKTNAQGKVVNYGNGVSIDTDDVTYIENGPNYHNYTFNIKQENSPADAPVENLVLSPLTDGTYRELLFSYNFTPQEKQTLMNGGFVDTKNKVTVTDLQKGTFNNGGQLAKNTVCTWTIETHYTTCSQGVHSHGEPAGSGEPGTNTCAAPTLSQLIVMVVGDCKAIGEDGIPGGGSTNPGTTTPGGLGNGEDDGSGNTDFPSNEPGNCNGGLTAPQTPNYDISDGGCGGSIPSQPTLPLPYKTPCEKIKNAMSKAKEMNINPTIKSQNDIMKANITTDVNEKGFSFGFDSNGDYKTSAIVEMGTAGGEIPLSNLGFTPTGTSHNHNGTNRPPCPSPTDIYSLNTVNQIIPTFEYNLINGTDGSQFVMSIIDPVAFNNFVLDYPMNTNVDVFHAQNNPNGNNFWKKNSNIFKDFLKAAQYFVDQGESSFDAQAYGMVFVAQKYKMGIIMGKKDSNGNFRPMQISTKRNKDDFSKLNYELQYLCGL